MPKAEIIAIGSELLLGETQDTNTNYLLRTLRDMGIDVYRTTIIGDNPQRIASAIKESLSRADMIITTGGLGPTIDDPTRDAVALAFECKTVFKDELWMDIRNYFAKMGRVSSENNKRQAFIPECAESLANPVGTAPAFYVHQENKLVLSLPGVPSEMKYIIAHGGKEVIENCFPPMETILVRTLHTYGIGESIVDEMVGDLEASSNPTLGLSAKQGQIDLRLTVKGSTKNEAEEKLNIFEKQIRDRLGTVIFGTEEDTLYSVTNQMLRQNNIRLNILEQGTEGMIAKAIEQELIQSSQSFPSDASSETIKSDLKTIDSKSKSDNSRFTLTVLISPGENLFDHSQIHLKTAWKEYKQERFYNSLTFSKEQSVLAALNLVRTAIIEKQ